MANINTFYGGISNNDYLGAKGQINFLAGVDVRRNPRYIQLERKPSSLTTGLNSLPLCEAQGFWFTENGEVYAENGNLVYTTTAGTAIYNAVKFDSYLHFFDSGHYYYISIANANTTSWTPGDVTTTGVTSSSYYPLVSIGGYMYVGISTGLYKITQASPGVFSVTQITTFSTSSAIVGVTLHSQTLYVYDNNGRLNIFDLRAGIEASVGYKQFTESVRFVSNKGGLDLVFTGGIIDPSFNWRERTNMYVNAGVGTGSDQLISRVKYQGDITTIFGGQGLKYNYGSDNESSLSTTLYYGGVSYIPGKEENRGYIYTYGKNSDGFPDSAIISYYNNYQNKNIKRIGALRIGTTTNTLKFGYEDEDGLFKIDTVDMSVVYTGEYQDTGLAVLLKDDGGDLQLAKTIEGSIKIGCKVPDDSSIVIKYIKDDNSIATLGTITNSNATNYTNYTAIGKFNEIQWIIELNASTDGLSTPKLYNFDYKLKLIHNTI